jgi:hypothetical protein
LPFPSFPPFLSLHSSPSPDLRDLSVPVLVVKAGLSSWIEEEVPNMCEEDDWCEKIRINMRARRWGEGEKILITFLPNDKSESLLQRRHVIPNSSVEDPHRI